MKKILQNICAGIFVLGLLHVIGLMVWAFIDIWVGGQWYIVVGIIIFILGTIGMVMLAKSER